MIYIACRSCQDPSLTGVNRVDGKLREHAVQVNVAVRYRSRLDDILDARKCRNASNRSLGLNASRLFESLSKVFRTAAGIGIIIVQGP